MYTFFEHTADMGIRIEAPDLPALFADAARGLFALLTSDSDQVRPLVAERIALSADRSDDLLHDWLAELLFLFDARHLLLSDFQVQVDESRLEAVVRGEPIDPERHPLGMEIKAITYHGLSVERGPSGWTAEVIVDL